MSKTVKGSGVGSRWGPYQLIRLCGGMGEVYGAGDTVKERVVALKLMSEASSQDPVFRERMQQEARTAGRLQESHVVPIGDCGAIDGQLYLDGRLIRRHRPHHHIDLVWPADPAADGGDRAPNRLGA
jgi:hypothetical protein